MSSGFTESENGKRLGVCFSHPHYGRVFLYCLCVAALFATRELVDVSPFHKTSRTFKRAPTKKIIEDSSSKMGACVPCGKPRKFIQNRNLAFIHIPKTGGEHLENILGIRKDHTYADDPSRPRRTCPARLHVDWQQIQIVERPSLSDTLCNFTNVDKYFFAVVRNPFDRLYSWFRFCLHGWRGHMPTPETAKCRLIHNSFVQRLGGNWAEKLLEKDFHRHVREIFTIWLKETYRLGHSQHNGEQDAGFIWSPYVRWLTDHTTGELLVDFIVRFEDDRGCYTRENLLCEIGRTVGREILLEKHNNSTTGSNFIGGTSAEVLHMLSEIPYHYFFTTETQKMVEDTFRIDLQLFNYSFRGKH